MHRFYLRPQQCLEPTLVLAERESHHAADVLRIRKGEQVLVLNGAGATFLCTVREVHRKSVVLDVAQKTVHPPLPYAMTLVQAVPKGKMMEFIIQKATELGVSRIVPLLTERVTTQLDGEGAQQKAEKWQQIAIEAIKQCGQTWLPRVDPPLEPNEFLKQSESVDLSFVGSLEGDGRHPREYFDSFFQQHHRTPKSLALWIGPEGDFTPGEMEMIRSSGVLPVTFGTLVLRSETAALYAMSIASYELQARRKSQT